MDGLLKIRDVTAKYGVSARTLRYYEDMGLIRSTRSADYAYRLYGAPAVGRLEQILILRRLNVSIRDIQRVFAAPGSDVVLEVLGKKVADIDEEIALLHELKDIVLGFIRQIERADFSNGADVKLLYDKAKEIEAQLAGSGYAGNPSPAAHAGTARLGHAGNAQPGHAGNAPPGRAGEAQPAHDGDAPHVHAGNTSPARRLFEVADKLEQKALSRLVIPDNVLKRALRNVYFILGDGAAVADELGRRHGIFVYHTCDYRSVHFQNADPEFQPGLARFVENMPDFFTQDPEDAMQRERGIVRDYTPMVITDLIQLAAVHDKVICENDIDVDSIVQIVTHAAVISNDKPLDDFIRIYEGGIRSRDIPESEKERLVRKVNDVWGKGKPESPRGANQYGIKQIYAREYPSVGQMADAVAGHFGLA